jgi:hypothetical protein
MTRPIKPAEVGSLKSTVFPAPVFDAFNAEIAAKHCNGLATVYQDAVVDRMVNAGLLKSEIMANGWLNVEDAYRDAGWSVTYHKPGYNESGRSYFEFRQQASGGG